MKRMTVSVSKAFLLRPWWASPAGTHSWNLSITAFPGCKCSLITLQSEVLKRSSYAYTSIKGTLCSSPLETSLCMAPQDDSNIL